MMGQTESLNKTGARLILSKCASIRLCDDEALSGLVSDIEGLARTIASTESAAPALLAACEEAAETTRAAAEWIEGIRPLLGDDSEGAGGQQAALELIAGQLDAAIAAARPEASDA